MTLSIDYALQLVNGEITYDQFDKHVNDQLYKAGKAIEQAEQEIETARNQLEGYIEAKLRDGSGEPRELIQLAKRFSKVDAVRRQLRVSVNHLFHVV